MQFSHSFISHFKLPLRNSTGHSHYYVFVFFFLSFSKYDLMFASFVQILKSNYVLFVERMKHPSVRTSFLPMVWKRTGRWKMRKSPKLPQWPTTTMDQFYFIFAEFHNKPVQISRQKKEREAEAKREICEADVRQWRTNSFGQKAIRRKETTFSKLFRSIR